MFFAGVFICATIAIVGVIKWKKKRAKGTKFAQTSPLQSSLSQAEIGPNSGMLLETEAEPQEPEIMEVICLQCGHSCVASTEICPTCGRKLTK